MIRVAELSKRHAGRDQPVLRGVSFAVAGGELAAVVGMSGAGKTTLLRCLCGLEGFDAGSIALADLSVAPRDHAQLRGRVGLVFQSLELFPHLTVLDNCTLAPVRVRGVARGAAESRARALLEALGLAEHARSFPDYLSGGQRQRVAIARALAMEPRVLLYDEPTSALDPALKREVAETLKRVRATGVTQVVVTHDLEMAREAADRVFLLEKGAILDGDAAAQAIAKWGQ